MAFFFGDGFDCYALPADALLGYWDSGTTNFTLAAGRFSGSRALQNSGAVSGYLTKSSGSNDAVHHLVFAVNFTATPSAGSTGACLSFVLYDGTTAQCTVAIRQDGALILTSGSLGTTLATYTSAITASGWNAFEVEVVINNTTGSFAVRKNGNTVNDFSATSLNTRGSANNYANKLTVHNQNSPISGNLVIDDLLWRSDSTAPAWVGDIRCFTRRPASDAAVQWTRSGPISTPLVSGSMSTSSVSSGQARYTPFTPTYDGTIGSVTVNFAVASTANLKCAIYASSASLPTTVLGTATPISAPGVGYATFTFPTPVSVVGGTPYFLAVVGDANSGQFASTTANSGLFGTVTYATFPINSPTTSGAFSSLQSNFFLTTAANSTMVGEPQQDAAASYVYSSTVGQSDLYGLTGIDSTPTSIIGVTTRALAQKSDAGTRIITADLKSGGTTVHSGSGVLNTTWSWTYRTDLTDPNTGAAWTPTAVNNCNIGVTVTA